MLPPRLSSEIELLREAHQKIDVVEEGDMINLVIRDFPTSPLFNRPTTTLLVRVPRAYPDAGVDMFWTDVELTLADGSIPSAGDSIEQYSGRSWRRFSWHHGGWNPNLHSLRTYLVFVRRRFNVR